MKQNTRPYEMCCLSSPVISLLLPCHKNTLLWSILRLYKHCQMDRHFITEIKKNSKKVSPQANYIDIS